VKILSADDILKANDLERITIEVPEWGGSVEMWDLTEQESTAWEKEIAIEDGKESGLEERYDRVRVSLVARVLRKPDGTRLFGESQLEALGKKSGKPIRRLFEIALERNGIRKANVEEMVKNFVATPIAGSSSA
jgi:hypothetical protein